MARLVVILVVLLVGGCAGEQAFFEGRRLIEAGDVEQGLARVQEAARRDPHNQEYRNYYERQRAVAVQRYLALAENARRANAPDQAAQAYQRVLGLDPANARAQSGLEALQMDRRHRAALVEAEAMLKKGDTAGASAKARQILAENPSHGEARALVRRIDEGSTKAAAAVSPPGAAFRKPVTLEFRDASLRTVFDLISKHTGVTFLLDRDVRPDQRTTAAVRNAPIEELIRIVLLTNRLERRVLNADTVLIYPNTPAKARDYKELVVKSFYLANADARQTAHMIRALVKTRDLYVDEKLNLLVIRDTPEVVRIAERLVANQDLGEPEVMLELEVLEVSATVLTDIGIQWPSQVSGTVVGAAGKPGTITLRELGRLSSGMVQLTFSDPLFALNFLKQDGRTNVLANPRIRVKNKDKARIHIGDKVPVITTTATATGFVSETVSYLDTGLKLEVEPTVFLENDVGIKVGLEVSNIAREIKTATGSVTYQIGTRNAATTLRLKDGETQVLAGLISDEDRRNANKVPGLGDLPTVGRLFSSNRDTVNKTEIVLLITPRVVRNLARPDVAAEEFSSGTRAEVGGAAVDSSSEPDGAPSPPVAPAQREAAPYPSLPPGAPPPVAPGAPR